jgi:hypothetical protein
MRLVDSDKPAKGYLYEAMDRTKEVIWAYYVSKGTLGFSIQMVLWDLIDSRWIGMSVKCQESRLISFFDTLTGWSSHASMI